jgi:hypothetical protein
MSAARDRLARWLCNLILRTIATPWYRDRIDGAIRYGLASAARDETEGRPAPKENGARLKVTRRTRQGRCRRQAPRNERSDHGDDGRQPGHGLPDD